MSVAVVRSVDPARGETIAEYTESTADEVERIVRAAHEAHVVSRGAPPDSRTASLRGLAELLRSGADRLGELMTREMGKPRSESVAEIEKCVWLCEHYASEGPRYLAPEPIASGAGKSYVAYEPLGVVLAIMPWNFPFWQVVRFAAPALLAGNSVVLKHAPNVTGCAYALEELFGAIGLTPDSLRVVVLSNERTGDLIEHPLVKAVTLTGSTRAGRAVAARAGACLKKTVLELGGSDPYVILDDADLEPAVEACVTGRLINGGQSCIAAKRIVVTERTRGEVERRVVERMRAVTPGDPLADGTKLGPLARADLRDNLDRQVRESVERGARLLLGGEVPEGPGCFYPATVLTDVRPGMPAFDEELFGPVAAILPVPGEEEALRVANASEYGLGSAIFTTNAARGEEIARERLEAGSAFVNDFVRSDPRLPFGGVKSSGWGRELGPHGIREFVNVKTIWIK